MGKSAEGQTKTIPINAENRSDLGKVTVDTISHKTRMPQKVSDRQAEIDEDFVFLTDTLRIDVYIFLRRVRKNIRKQPAIIPSDNNRKVEIVIDSGEEFDKREIRNGAFWSYLNKTKIDLSRYQIFNSLNKDNYKDNRLIYAFKQSGLYDESFIDMLIRAVKVIDVPLTSRRKLSEGFEIPIKVSVGTDTAETKLDTNKRFMNKPVLNLLLCKNRYMLNETLPISLFCLKNMQKLDELFKDMPFEKRMTIECQCQNNSVKEYKKTPTKSGTILDYILENNMLESIYNMNEIMQTGIKNNNDLEEYVELDFDKDLCCRAIDSNTYLKKMEDTEFSSGVYYSNFETDTTTSSHTPDLNVSIGGLNNVKKAFVGSGIGMGLINYLPNNSSIYFHNLKYDACFFMNESDDYSCNIIQRNGQVIQLVIKTYKPEKKVLTFRDSYSLIPSKLAKFDETFGLKVHKEAMPCKLYTKIKRERKMIPLHECFEQLAVENQIRTLKNSKINS